MTIWRRGRATVSLYNQRLPKIRRRCPRGKPNRQEVLNSNGGTSQLERVHVHGFDPSCIKKLVTIPLSKKKPVETDRFPIRALF